jgi:hypothetical protein
MILCFLVLLIIGCAPTGLRAKINLCSSASVERAASFERTSQGSLIDLKRTMASLKCLDGGDLEDAHIAIGTGLFRFTGTFAPQIRASDLTENDLEAISMMLPSSFVDEPCKREAEFSRRRELVKTTVFFGSLAKPIMDALDYSLLQNKNQCENGASP